MPELEQVRKGGLPPLVPDLIGWVRAGVNRPSLLVTLPGVLFPDRDLYET